MNKYNVSDGVCESTVEAATPKEAARKWVDGGEWGRGAKTVWVSVMVTLLDGDGQETGQSEDITVTLDPELECIQDAHDWQSPLEVVGGIKENPGVYGHGGGVIITAVCSHCGCYRIIDSWAQNPENGEQGLQSTEYREADNVSRAWVSDLAKAQGQ